VKNPRGRGALGAWYGPGAGGEEITVAREGQPVLKTSYAH